MIPTPLRDRFRVPDSESVSQRMCDWNSVAALLVVAGKILLNGSGRSVLLAIPLLILATLTPATVGFAAGQLALLFSLSVGDTIALVIAQLALLVVLTEPARTHGIPRVIGTTLVAYLVLGGVFASSLSYGLVVTGGLLGLTVAVGTYVIYRVTVVQLGMVTDDADPTTTVS